MLMNRLFSNHNYPVERQTGTSLIPNQTLSVKCCYILKLPTETFNGNFWRVNIPI